MWNSIHNVSVNILLQLIYSIWWVNILEVLRRYGTCLIKLLLSNGIRIWRSIWGNIHVLIILVILIIETIIIGGIISSLSVCLSIGIGHKIDILIGIGDRRLLLLSVKLIWLPIIVIDVRILCDKLLIICWWNEIVIILIAILIIGWHIQPV